MTQHPARGLAFWSFPAGEGQGGLCMLELLIVDGIGVLLVWKCRIEAFLGKMIRADGDVKIESYVRSHDGRSEGKYW